MFMYQNKQTQCEQNFKINDTFIFQQQKLIITTTESNKQMIDIYLIITPIAGLLVLLTVVNIKLTLNEPSSRNLNKYEKKKKDQVKQERGKSKNQQQGIQHAPAVEVIVTQVKEQVKDDIPQSGLKKTLMYLLKHWTPLELFLVRRSRNKIPLILSTTIISVLSITINLPIAFCFINTLLTMTFLLGKMLSDDSQEQQLATVTIHPENRQLGQTINNEKVKQKQDRFQHKLEVIFTSLSLVGNIIFIWIVYKNYHNQFLISAVQNILITCVVDNFLVKPVVLTITAFFIKNVLFVDLFIAKEIQIVEILHEERVLKKSVDYHISSLSPKKMVSSPSKVPKAVRVEPRINVQSTDQFISRISLTKSLQKPNFLPISGRKLQHENIEGDCSLLSIMNSHEKKLTNNSQTVPFDFDKQLFEQKVQETEQPVPQIVEVEVQVNQQTNQDEVKQTIPNGQENKSKRSNSKLMMISHDNSIIDNLDAEGDEKIQQEDDDGHHTHMSNNKSAIKSMRDSGEYNTILSANKHEDFKISLNGSIQDHLSGRQHFEDFFEADRYNQMRPQTFEEETSILGSNSVAASSGRNGLLKINEDRKAEDLEEIDLNSPQRRKNQLKKAIEDSQIPKKKKKNQKKYSLDPNRYVIKHSTGEPYLEFLPNLLNKERQEKKKKSTNNYGSQNTFSRKVDLVNGQLNDMRVTKSVKRQKNTKDFIMKQNDQNKVPQFTIEEY